MRKQLLAALALCLSASASLPAWAVDYEAPTLATVTPNLATDGTGGGKYYIYHVATRKFIAAGNTAGTQLSVDSIGQEMTLNYGPERAPLYGQSPKVPGEGWIFNMLNGPANGSRFHEVYATSGGQAYVDCGSDGHTLWQILPQGNGYYQIKIVDQDPDFGLESGNASFMNGVWGVLPASTAVYPFVEKAQAGYEDAETDWAFATPEAYAVFQAKNQLHAQLVYADGQGYTDVADYEALYASTTASADDIAAAARRLAQAVNDQLGAGATEAEPLDFTYLITNADFANGNTGWTEDGGAPGLGHQSGTTYTDPDDPTVVMAHFSEKWRASGGSNMHLYQTLSNMPAGRYRLTAFTLGYNQANLNDNHRGVYVFANGYRAEAQTARFGGVSSAGVEPSTVPCPRQVTLDFYLRGGDLQLGFMTENTNCNWVGVDNFQLFFLGNEGGIAAELARVAEQAEAYKADLDATGTYCSQAQRTAFSDAIDAARNAADGLSDDEVAALIEQLNVQLDAMKADVAVYARLTNEILPAIVRQLDDSPYADMGLPTYEDFIDEITRAQYTGALSPEEIEGLEARAAELFKQDVAALLQSGELTNITGLLSNPNFTSDLSGWTKTGNGDFKHGSATGEVWNGRNWEMYQEVAGLPEGFYRITAQSFYCPCSPNNADWHASWGVAGDTNNDVKAYLFANDASALLHHVASFPQDSNMGNGCELVSGTADDNLNGKYLPVNLAGVEAVFSANPANYLNEVSTYVGADGILRLGIRMVDAPLNNVWSAFDNFSIEYVGAIDPAAAAATLRDKVAEASNVLNSGTNVAEVVNQLDGAVTAATLALNAELTAEVYNTHMAALNLGIAMADTARAAVAEVDELATRYDNAYSAGDYDSYDPDDVDELAYLISDAFDFVDNGFETIAQARQMAADLNEAYGLMRTHAMDTTDASLDAPADLTGLLLSPSFEDADGESTAEGWNTTAGTVTSAANYEFFNLADAEVSQTLYGLPAGYYRLAYNGFYRAGGYVEGAASRIAGEEAIHASAFAEAGDSLWTRPLVSIFEGVHDYLYTNSDVILPDTLRTQTALIYNCIVNDVAGAKAAFSYGEYADSVAFRVEAGQTLTVGVRKGEAIVNDWTIFDNFRLYYLGDGDENRPADFGATSIEEVAAQQASVVRTLWFTLHGVRVDNPSQRGVYIRQDVMSDGSKQATKVLLP